MSEEINETTYKNIDELPEAPKRPVGRPVKKGSGTFIQPVSAPYSWRSIMEKYNISPSVAFQQGILLLLHQHPRFPETTYEELMPKGLHVEKIEVLTQALTKVRE